MGKIEMLKRASASGVQSDKNLKKVSKSEEVQALDRAKRRNAEKLRELRNRAQRQLFAKNRRLRKKVKKRMTRRLDRRVANWNKKMQKWEVLLVNAKGAARLRLLDKLKSMKKDRDRTVKELSRRMKRRLKRRLKRNDKTA